MLLKCRAIRFIWLHLSRALGRGIWDGEKICLFSHLIYLDGDLEYRI